MTTNQTFVNIVCGFESFNDVYEEDEYLILFNLKHQDAQNITCLPDVLFGGLGWSRIVYIISMLYSVLFS